MNGKWVVGLVALLSALALWWSPAEAGMPWDGLLSIKKVDADPDKSYPLTEENGPWMILACPFSGLGAEEQARQVVYELRKRYKLEAYIYRQRFEFGKTLGRGLDPTGAPILMRHRRNGLQEIAVLVGNYPSVDDPDAQKTLRKLKYSHPKSLAVREGETTYQTLAGWRMAQKQLQEFFGSAKQNKGPMGHAFMIPNPLLGKEYFTSAGIDPLVVRMNQDVKHSLLDCKGKYTVQVATFKGQVVINQSEIKAINRAIAEGKKVKSDLAEAATKAHRMTEALRMKGWEAYEFHDRYASIVTVGSFQSAGVPRPDGMIEINPKVHTIIKTFGAQQMTLPGQVAGVTAVKDVLGIPLDVQPILVHVPKRSIGREMARRPF